LKRGWSFVHSATTTTLQHISNGLKSILAGCMNSLVLNMEKNQKKKKKRKEKNRFELNILTDAVSPVSLGSLCFLLSICYFVGGDGGSWAS